MLNTRVLDRMTIPSWAHFIFIFSVFLEALAAQEARLFCFSWLVVFSSFSFQSQSYTPCSVSYFCFLHRATLSFPLLPVSVLNFISSAPSCLAQEHTCRAKLLGMILGRHNAETRRQRA